MKQIFHPYHLWEDVKGGILENGYNEIETEELTLKAKKLLCNPDEFYIIGLRVLDSWRLMTKEEQDKANKIADKLIKLWEGKNA